MSHNARSIVVSLDDCCFDTLFVVRLLLDGYIRVGLLIVDFKKKLGRSEDRRERKRTSTTEDAGRSRNDETKAEKPLKTCNQMDLISLSDQG